MSEDATESAIDGHLRCPRSRPRRIADDYAPPYPAWVARADASVRQVVMGCFGVQSRGDADRARAAAALAGIVRGFAQPDGPGHHDLAHFTDSQGFDNLVAIAYWDDPQRFARWRDAPAVDAAWRSAGGDGLGYFREVALPRAAHFETLFSTQGRPEGVACVMGRQSGAVQEHAYWGSMRDRLPIAQTDALAPEGVLALLESEPGGKGRRVRVAGHRRVALIRSGQDWSETEGRERDLYLQEMAPVLRAGMDFLHTQGLAIGCYSNRYMRHLDASGRPMEKSFGLSHWRSLGDMERWSESHPTHVAIFGTFMRIVQELAFQLRLRLYHEVAVLEPDEQHCEYVDCHARTGLMNGPGAG